jgi:hypothetical protein
VAVTAAALLATSFAPWWEDVSRTANAWPTSMWLAGAIVLVLASAAVWLLGSGHEVRIAAASGSIAGGSGLIAYVWGHPSFAIHADGGWTLYAPLRNGDPANTGFRYGAYAGCVLVAVLSIAMVVGLFAGIARRRPSPQGQRRAIATVTVMTIATLLVVSFAPWWQTGPATTNAWTSSTVWSIALATTVVALSIELIANSFAGRIVATVFSICAATAAVSYTLTLSDASVVPDTRRYVDYLPEAVRPVRRDHLKFLDGYAGPAFGAYVGLGLMCLIAVALLARVALNRTRDSQPVGSRA